MALTFYGAALVAVVSTAMAITRTHAVHALLYLIVSLLAVALIFFLLGAPFAAALEVIVYAGAIMVLFLFVVMLLNLGHRAAEQERHWLPRGIWIGPCLLAAILVGETLYLFSASEIVSPPIGAVSPKEVSTALLGRYVIGVELASMLLLPGLVAAYHLGRKSAPPGNHD
jgi:NADH-quinone oxidoreductase subunit J